jgi:molybdopterin-containing oxidoreductase family membrane subunit
MPSPEVYFLASRFYYHRHSAFFILLYMIASRLIPLVPVWEVQEGQLAHSLRRVGKATVKTVSEIE